MIKRGPFQARWGPFGARQTAPILKDQTMKKAPGQPSRDFSKGAKALVNGPRRG